MNTEFYTPPSIFRQPAMRRVSGEDQRKSSYRRDFTTDIKQLSSENLIKTLSSQKKMVSQYWSMVDTTVDMSYNGENIAVSTTGSRDNLKFFNAVTASEFMSVTLPFENTSLHWADHEKLLCGDANGGVSMIGVPEFGNASIIKRFSCSKVSGVQSAVKSLCNAGSHNFMLVHESSLFKYNYSYSNPVMKKKVDGLRQVQYVNDSVTACAGDFGVVLLDLRTASDHCWIPHDNLTKVTALDTNDNFVVCGGRSGRSDVIKLWDIRKPTPMAEFICPDTVRAVTLTQDVYSGDDSGNIIKWDMSSVPGDNSVKCTMAHGLSSIKVSDGGKFMNRDEILGSLQELQNGHVVGTTKNVKKLQACMGQVVSLDSEFVGIHCETVYQESDDDTCMFTSDSDSVFSHQEIESPVMPLFEDYDKSFTRMF